MARMTRLTLAVLGTAVVATIAGSAAQTLQPQAPPGQVEGRGRGQAVTLPDGQGKEFAQAMCVTCHPLTMITGSAGYNQQGWQDLIATMVRLPDAQVKSVTEYLAAHFPPKPERRPTLVAGDTQITFKEWIAPTLGQRVRDPLQLTDHTIYWTGMFASLIGQLDPKTGEMR